ncbi:MAG: hypothetical protein ACTSXJ_02070 [Candidatus Baldrarchaeia archaeon]
MVLEVVGTTSILASVVAAYLLLRPAIVYKKVEKGTLFFAIYYVLGILGQIDVLIWSVGLFSRDMFALIWFTIGMPTGAIGWLLLSEIFVHRGLRRAIRILIIVSVVCILLSLPFIGIHVVRAEIFDEPGVPLWFSAIMKIYAISGGLLIVSVFILSAIKLKSARIALLTLCLVVWALSHHLLLNFEMLLEYFALHITMAGLIVASTRF